MIDLQTTNINKSLVQHVMTDSSSNRNNKRHDAISDFFRLKHHHTCKQFMYHCLNVCKVVVTTLKVSIMATWNVRNSVDSVLFTTIKHCLRLKNVPRIMIKRKHAILTSVLTWDTRQQKVNCCGRWRRTSSSQTRSVLCPGTLYTHASYCHGDIQI